MSRLQRLAPLFVLFLFASFYAVAPAYADCTSPTPTPGTSYSSIVTGTQSGHLIGYWKLDETGGTTAADSSGSSRNGTYSGPTLNGAPFVDGSPAPSFDGVNDVVNIFSSSLQSAMNFNQGTLSIWIKADAAFLASTTSGEVAILTDTGVTSGVAIFKTGSANQFFFRRYEAGTPRTITVSMSSSSWTHFLFTWNVSGNAITAYVNGSSSGTPSTAATVTASLGSTRTALGAGSSSGTTPWKGGLAQVALWDTVLSASEITALAAAPSATPTPVPTCTPSPSNTPTNTFTPTITPSASYTPSLTPSLTPTASNTANVYVHFTLEPPESTGTPQPGQAAEFAYTASAGQVGIVVILAAILFSMWAAFLILMTIRRRNSQQPTTPPKDIN